MNEPTPLIRWFSALGIIATLALRASSLSAKIKASIARAIASR
jgi:hypothetical protein